jgi:hypothetical protein
MLKHSKWHMRQKNLYVIDKHFEYVVERSTPSLKGKQYLCHSLVISSNLRLLTLSQTSLRYFLGLNGIVLLLQI